MPDLDPQDMPPDPFGETGMAQLICPCTCETFHYVFTPTTVRAICSACATIAGEWPRQGLDAETAQPMPAPQPLAGQRDTLATSGHELLACPCGQFPWAHTYADHKAQRREVHQAGAGWGGEVPELPTRFDPSLMPQPSELPRFSSGICNVYLDGGPYDGQITALMAGASQFVVTNVPGVYAATERVRDGRIVYTYQGS